MKAEPRGKARRLGNPKGELSLTLSPPKLYPQFPKETSMKKFLDGDNASIAFSLNSFCERYLTNE